ncbi:MAG: YitT family protein, partial [Coprobacillus sp.]|nr:YitT family protein [Coprobacillus sp.]
YQADIISSHNDEISRYIQDELGRGVTIIEAKGGYHGDDRPILRVVFDRSQLNKLRDYVAKVDPSAFMSITQTSAVYGEGFKTNKPSSRGRKKKDNSEIKTEENSEEIKENNEDGH